MFLLALLPLYALIGGLGASFLFESRKKLSRYLLFLILGAILVNFSDFTHYYWYKYPRAVQADFSSTSDANY